MFHKLQGKVFAVSALNQLCVNHYKQCLSHQKCVSTWSSLGAVFNAMPAKRFNRKLLKGESGLFRIPQLSSNVGFYALKETSCNSASQLVAEAVSPERSRKLVDVFDDLSNTLCCVADLAEFIRVAHPSAAYREAAEDAAFHIGTVVEQLNTNQQLYKSLQQVVEKGDKFPTTDVDHHVAKLFLFDFEQSGIQLEEESREKVVTLLEAIMQLGQHFINGTSRQRAIDRNKLPPGLRPYFPSENEQLIVSNMQPETALEPVREAAYRIYLYPDSHQEYLLHQLHKARRNLATLCGFPSYAHRATRGTTAETPEFVNSFLNTLNHEMKPLVEEDLKHLLVAKKQDDRTACAVHPWDLSYLTSKIQHQYLKDGTTEFTEFFCLGACMEGLNNLTQQLFGISLKSEELHPGEAWAPEVYKLVVEHEIDGLLGHIYCDFYRRPGKPQQDCHFTIRGGKLLEDGSYQTPIVVLMLGLHAPRWSGPCLLSQGQLENLAHEMGHALHSMMARTRHQHVTGTRCATDFAEVPSILMEYFLADPRVLKTFAKHFQTKESLPEDVVVQLCNAKHLLTATETQTQILYSIFDQRFHGESLEVSTTELFTQLQRDYFFLPPVENTGWQLRFSHLVGYGARYYSYLLSRSVASCIWQTYFARDPFSREAGEKYRRDCLSHGGGKPPRLILAHFLGQQIQPEDMASSLVRDITHRQRSLNQQHLNL